MWWEHCRVSGYACAHDMTLCHSYWPDLSCCREVAELEYVCAVAAASREQARNHSGTGPDGALVVVEPCVLRSWAADAYLPTWAGLGWDALTNCENGRS
jgi:hypothetical protein